MLADFISLKSIYTKNNKIPYRVRELKFLKLESSLTFNLGFNDPLKKKIIFKGLGTTIYDKDSLFFKKV
jgi:hypothetical protein